MSTNGDVRPQRRAILAVKPDDPAVGKVLTSVGTAGGHGVGEIGCELIDDPVVPRRQHEVESAVLAVQGPASIVHLVTDGVDVDAASVGSTELAYRHVGVRGDLQPVLARNGVKEPIGGGGDPAGKSLVTLDPQMVDHRPGPRDWASGARTCRGARRVEAPGPVVEPEHLVYPTVAQVTSVVAPVMLTAEGPVMLKSEPLALMLLHRMG